MLEIINAQKEFNHKVVFQNISIKFPNKGIFMILGPSGCGKSTLLNIITGLEELTKGKVVFRNKELKTKKDFLTFRRKYVSFLFQDYGLIENYDIKTNIEFPLMIEKDKRTNDKIKKALKKVGVNKKLSDKCNLLSGGEKQRIALARLLVDNKKIVLCDEPTGSLDNDNAKNVFETLKEISKDKLVICVTHSIELTKEYADYVFDFEKNDAFECQNNAISESKVRNKSFSFSDSMKLSIQSLLCRKGRTVLSLISFVLVMIFMCLTLSLSLSINLTLTNNVKHYLNYNMVEVSLEESSSLGNSGFSLVKSKRPKKEDLIPFIEKEHYQLSYNFDYLLSGAEFYCENQKINAFFSPVDFISSGYYEELRKPISEMKIDQVFVNESAKELLKSETIHMDVYSKVETTDSSFNRAYDDFSLSLDLQVIGVVKEFRFMSMPTIYYSYQAMKTYFLRTEIPNASYLLHKPLTYYDRLSTLSSDSEDLSSYSYLLFLDEENVMNVKSKLEKEGFNVTSYPLSTADNLSNILSSIEMVLQIFLVLSLIIVYFLVSMVMFSFVVDRKREIGILSVIGISNSQIKSMFAYDGGLISFTACLLSLLLLPYVLKIANAIIFKLTYIENLLYLPFSSLGDIRFGFQICFICISVLVGFFCGYVPAAIALKTKISNILREQ